MNTIRDFSMWNLTGTLNIYLVNHHLKDYQIPITIDMVKKAISKLKSSKAAGP